MRLRFNHWLRTIPAQDPTTYEMLLLLQGLLFGVLITLWLTLGVNLVVFGPAALTVSGLRANLAIQVCVAAAIVLLRQGRSGWSIRLVIVALLGGLGQALLNIGFHRSVGILSGFVIPISLAGLILGRQALILVSCSSIAIVAWAAVIDAMALSADPALEASRNTYGPLVVFSLVVALFSLFLDRFVGALRQALATAATHSIQLNAAREHFEITLASIGDAVITTDRAGTVAFMNPVAEALTGWAQAEAIGQPLDAVFQIANQYSRQRMESPVAKVLHDGSIVGVANHTLLLSRDGREIPIDDSSAPITGRAGTLDGVVLVFRDVTDRKHAVQAIEASEARFRTLANAAPVLIWMADVAGGCYFFNQTWLDFTGRSYSQELGDGWTEGVHPDDLHCLTIYRSAFAAREPFQLEYRLRRADGNYRWLFDHGVPLATEAGEFTGFIGSCTDITERKLLEDRLNTLIEASGNVLQSLYRDDVLPAIIALAQQLVAADAYGIWRQNPATGAWNVLAAAGLSDEFQQETIRSMGDAPVTVTAPWLVADIQQEPGLQTRRAVYARERIAALLIMPLCLHGVYAGTLVFYYHQPQVFADLDVQVASALANLAAAAITTAELYETQHLLRDQAEADQRKQTFLANASALLASSLDYQATLGQIIRLVVPSLADWAAVYMLEADGSVRQLAVGHQDPQKERLALELQHRYPFSPAQSAGLRHVIESGESLLVPDLTAASMEAGAIDAEKLALTQALELSSYVLVPLVVRERTLGVLTFATTGQRQMYSAADLPLFEALAQRVTIAIENARLYAEAQQAIAIRDQFFSIASHELKTPTTSILGYAQLLERRMLRKAEPDERLQHPLQAIMQQTHRLNRLVLAMLDLSRVQTGQLRLTWGSVAVSSLIERVAQEARLTTDRHQITVTAPEDPVVIPGDDLRLEQVLYNLVQNAIKYSPQGGPITIALTLEPDSIAIAVTDRGIGIPADEQPGLFQRFYRATNAAATTVSGLGLGLYIVQDIVSRHGGTISVASTEGLGSSFTINLPRRGPGARD
jgi:PAS domain S-box-containing protein